MVFPSVVEMARGNDREKEEAEEEEEGFFLRLKEEKGLEMKLTTLALQHDKVWKFEV